MSQLKDALCTDEGAAADYQRLLELLRAHAYTPGTVRLASGRESDFYIDCRRVTLLAEGHRLVGRLFGRLLQLRYPDLRLVAGAALGACPIASATATLSKAVCGCDVDALYVRSQAKDHGSMQWVEGTSLASDDRRVVVLEDVVTSGRSSLATVQRLRDAGWLAVAVCALVDRDEGGGAAIARELEFCALYQRSDFV